MITGVPNFLPSIQNFSIPEVVLQDGNDVLNYKAQFNNVTLYGLESYKFKRYNFDYKNLTFFIDVDIPHIYIEGNYLVEGKLFFAPLKGNGNFHIKLSKYPYIRWKGNFFHVYVL
nr:unnamed protein product [Callosobruchus chinensis]